MADTSYIQVNCKDVIAACERTIKMCIDNRRKARNAYIIKYMSRKNRIRRFFHLREFTLEQAETKLEKDYKGSLACPRELDGSLFCIQEQVAEMLLRMANCCSEPIMYLSGENFEYIENQFAKSDN